MSPLKPVQQQQRPHYPFWFGGSASCMAACITHPLDLVKVRLQTAAQSGARPKMISTFSSILRNEGFLAIYSGLSASLLRQATYSTTRFGAYEEMKSRLKTPSGERPSFGQLVFMACASGWLGGLAGNPADVINVRMQNDSSLPASKRRNYSHAIDGLIRMSREEGITSLFRGAWPNTFRAALMTASQLATYDEAKILLIRYTPLDEGLLLHFSASLLSGLVATTICSPVDVVKTRVMSSHDKHGMLHLLKETTRREGWGWMFRGWVPSFIRLGPHTIFTFIALEQHKKMWRYMHPLRAEEETVPV
ncbi:mitochondrial carrier [Ascodesmis nigricans]|uniref:Mitochondrial carrier n=1 Tax=Ascodesmis nigricans TaxID=341454 RepID=A0A4S2MXM5_9PEZI|nr:mitochondrial carrier [Ascodesmis nigricans]